MRKRFHAVALAGDLKQASLQVRMREEVREVIRFHWMNYWKPDKRKHIFREGKFELHN